LALLDGNQGPLVLGMTRLPPRFLAALFRLRRRLGVWMLARWRQRRIAGRLVQAGFQLRQSRLQFSDPRQQQTDDGLHLRRLPSNQLCGDQQFQRHVPDVAEIAN
jgi:hypothetical protein